MDTFREYRRLNELRSGGAAPWRAWA